MTRRIIHIIILGLLSISGYCGTPYCDIRKFSILDGLAANNISDLCQGADNMMWFATYNGLSYYDGYTSTPSETYLIAKISSVQIVFAISSLAPTMTFGVLHTTIASTYMIPVCATLLT